MKRRDVTLLLTLLILLTSPFFGYTTVFAAEDGPIIVYYFYVEECEHCKDAEAIIEGLEEEYSLEVNRIEVSENESNIELYQGFMQAYEVQVRDVPALFIGYDPLIGRDSTKENIEAAIKNSTGSIDPLLIVKERQSADEAGDDKIDITLSLVIGTALADGVNPCTFAVLMLLLSYLLSMKSKKEVLSIGLSFTASVFATYLLVGLGIIEYMLFSDAFDLIRGIVIIVAISAGVINIRDFWLNKATLAIPSIAMGTISRLGRNAAVPNAIVLGFFATLVELPCTGGIYLPILTMLAKTPSRAISYLLIYNLFYVLPLLVIIAITYKGTPPEDIEDWRIGWRRYMRLIGGMVMLFIGIGMFFGVI
ncbi:MAG: cytochrome c biogenesis protein CcdA [Halobacteriota archaeon]|nr:cytochrome c biogenesis protein CcdA [Halobacteriota archaeon]